MARSALWITALLAVSAVVLLAFHKGAADVVITSARRLLSEEEKGSHEEGEVNKVVSLNSRSRLRGSYDPNDYDQYPRRYQQGDFGSGYGDHGPRYRKDQSKQGANYWMQFLYGVVFYFLVASKYPQLEFVTERSAAIMNESPFFRINTGPICLQSLFCQNPMLAHVLHSTGSLNYWISLLLSMACPCCMVFAATHCLETHVKLGGQRKDILTHGVEAFFCSCCVIAQSNEALDAATGMQLGCCSVRRSEVPPQAGYAVMPHAVAVPQFMPSHSQAMQLGPSAPPLLPADA